MIDPATGDRIPNHHRVRLSIRSDLLDHEIWLPFMAPDQLTVHRLFMAVEKVLQSKKEWFFQEPFTVYFVHAPLPAGGGRSLRKEDAVTEQFLRSKKCIIRLPEVPGKMCCAASIVIAKRIVDGSDYREYTRSIRRLTRAAQDLHEEAGVPIGILCGPEQWPRFQATLGSQYELIILSRDFLDSVVYRGNAKGKKKIVLFHVNEHYYPVRSLAAFFGRDKVCMRCLKPYNYEHNCEIGCRHCPASEPCQEVVRQQCGQCKLFFPSQKCLENHRVHCGDKKRCDTCGYIMIKGRKHKCNTRYCATCQQRVEDNHQCFMQPKEVKDTQKSLFVVYDFESMLMEDNSHRVNLCVAHVVCGLCMTKPIDESCTCNRRREIFRGDTTVDLFVSWLLTLKKVIALAHNSRGYDAHFILDCLHRRAIKPQIIQTGCKIMRLQFKNVVLLDSLNFISMPLAKIPKAFGLKELHKGYFPHLFNRWDTQNYQGPLPAREFYNPEGMGVEAKAQFEAWYTTQEGQHFVLGDELLKYCVSDVDILQRGAGEFRHLFKETTGIDPFVSAVTIAAACNVAYRTLFLRPGQIPIVYPKPDNQSSIAMAWLEKRAKEDQVIIRHARNGGEVRVLGRLVDGMSGDNKIYEFLGCHWHGCPRCYRNREALHPLKKVPVREVYEATIHRLDQLRRAGYDLETQWECLFRAEVGVKALKTLMKPFLRTDPLQPRDSFFGGRTEVFKLYHRAAEGENIRYEDVCSLYPYICKYGLFPVGSPEILRGDDIPPSMVGLLKCKILPPRQLFMPVLPYRTADKLLFALCRTCAESRHPDSCPHDDPEDRAITGTWVSLEIDKAVEKGYVILDKYEAWVYPETTQYNPQTREGGLWAGYVDKFLKLKAEASGYPSHATTEEQKREYIQDYLRHEGIQLEPSKIQSNPGLRSLAKLCLNSFWVSSMTILRFYIVNAVSIYD